MGVMLPTPVARRVTLLSLFRDELVTNVVTTP